MNFNKRKNLFFILLSLVLIPVIYFFSSSYFSRTAYAFTCSWTGGVSTNWEDAGNWTGCGGHAPLPVDDVIIDQSVSININADTTITSLILGNVSGTSNPVLNFNYDAYLTNGLVISGGDLTVNTGANIRHTNASGQVVVGRLKINVTSGNAYIYGSINTNGNGFQGTWAGVGNGDGNNSLNDSMLEPLSIGRSGYAGGGGGAGTGAKGGGSVTLIVSGTTSVEGVISANGLDGANEKSGSGWGGSINIDTQSINGSGIISADTGTYNFTRFFYEAYGGRIYIGYSTNNTFTGTISNSGEREFYNGSGIIKNETTDTIQLVSDQTWRVDTDGEYISLGSLTVTNNSILRIEPTGTATTSSGYSVKLNLTNFTLDSGSKINATENGYIGRSGIYGLGWGPCSLAGGSYGGLGVGGNCTYGESTHPIELGSAGTGKGGGYAGVGGTGGGAVYIYTTGDITLNGDIEANGELAGQNTSYTNEAAGAGGSIYLVSKNFSGNGTLKANGGNSPGTSSYQKPAGGGRIAIYASQSDTFTGTIEVTGGTGLGTAQDGTLHRVIGRPAVLMTDPNAFQIHQTCPSSVQARFTAGDLGLVQSGQYSASLVNGNNYKFTWNVVKNEDAVNIKNTFGGQITLIYPDTSTETVQSARALSIPIPGVDTGGQYGIYTIEARAMNGDLCDSATIEITADPPTGIIYVDPAEIASVKISSSETDVTQSSSSGTHTLISYNSEGKPMARYNNVNLTQGRDWRAMKTVYGTFSDSSDIKSGGLIVHFPGGANAIPGLDDIDYTMFIAKNTPQEEYVFICPGVELASELSLDCDGGFALPEGTTGQYTVQITNIDGQDYWEVGGVTSTGGFGILEAGPNFRVELENDTVSATGDSELWFDTPIDITANTSFYITYDINFTGGSVLTANDISITCDSDGLAPISGTGMNSVTFSSFTNGYFEFNSNTDTCSDWIVVDINGSNGNHLTNPDTAGNYSWSVLYDIGSNGSIDIQGATLAYVKDENDILITANVIPVLDLELYEAGVDSLLNGTGANTCELGVLSINTVNTCNYDIGTGTNNLSGVSIYIQSDGELRDGLGNTIDACSGTNCDGLGNAGVTAGEEEYGIYISELGGGEYTAAGSFGTQYQAVPTSETLFASSSSTGSGTTINSITQRMEVTHGVSISTATAQGSYQHVITYTAFTN